MLKKIKPQRITEKIVTQIKEAIGSGAFKAGERLPAEREMAEQMGISRPSLREALHVLEHSGYVEVIQGKGTYVKEIAQAALTDPLSALILESESRYHEVYEFRTAIEVWAAGIAAQRCEEKELVEIGHIVREMEQCLETRTPLTQLDADFHLAIAKASRNSIYYHVSNTIFHIISDMTRVSHENLFPSRDDQKMLYEDHAAIFKAISSHNSDLARQLMHAHLLRVEERTAKIISIKDE